MSAQPIPAKAKSSEATRNALLIAARGRFLQESYENVGLRDIAGDVGVDVALIGRYFGSKEDLFREVLGMGRKKAILPPDLGPGEIPAFLAALFLSQDEEDPNENVDRLLIILRSASSPAASQVVREVLRRDVLVPLAEHLGGADAEVRASASMAVWMGMTILRTVLAVNPMCEHPPEIEQRLRALFTAALAED